MRKSTLYTLARSNQKRNIKNSDMDVNARQEAVLVEGAQLRLEWERRVSRLFAVFVEDWCKGGQQELNARSRSKYASIAWKYIFGFNGIFTFQNFSTSESRSVSESKDPSDSIPIPKLCFSTRKMEPVDAKGRASLGLDDHTRVNPRRHTSQGSPTHSDRGDPSPCRIRRGPTRSHPRCRQGSD